MKLSIYKRFIHISICVILVLGLVGVAQIVQAQDHAAPDNPLEESVPHSHMLLTAEPVFSVSDKVLEEMQSFGFDPAETNPPEKEQEKQPGETEDGEQSEEEGWEQPGTTGEEQLDADGINPSDQTEGNKDDKGQEEQKGGDDQSEDSKDDHSGSTGPGGTEEGLVFFTTTINDGATLRVPEYSFSIRHTDVVKEKQLQVMGTYYTLNDGDKTEFFNDTCDLTLRIGQNDLTVYVQHTWPDGEVREVRSKNYALYVDPHMPLDDFDPNTPYFNIKLGDSSLLQNGASFAYADLSVLPVNTDAADKRGMVIQDFQTTVNGQQLPEQWNSRVTLAEGENKLRFDVVFLEQGTIQRQQTREYVVSYETNRPIIHTRNINTNAEYSTVFVNDPRMSFQAWAVYGADEKEVPLQVTLNNQPVSPKRGTQQYDIQLAEGENIIRMESSYNGKDATPRSFSFTYTLSWIDTDLSKEQVINTESFRFFARLNPNVAPSTAKLYVEFRNKRVAPDANGYFDVTVPVNEWSNITLTVHDRSDIPKPPPMHCRVRFVRTETDDPDKMPILTHCTLPKEMRTTSQLFDMQVEAQDYKGNSLFSTGKYGSGIRVYHNGKKVADEYTIDATTTYRMRWEEGDNDVTVYLVDLEGYTNEYHFYVYYNKASTNEPIGHITISLEANTLGLGYIIPPTTVPIYANENAVYPLLHLLEEYGVQYSITGSPDSAFYLAHIIHGSLPGGYAIPEDLLEMIEEDYGEGVWNAHSNGSLGEFDFSAKSGWMYQQNGRYGTGLSNVYPQDGDVIRYRFTLAHGKDIGGYLGGGGGAIDGNYGKEW